MTAYRAATAQPNENSWSRSATFRNRSEAWTRSRVCRSISTVARFISYWVKTAPGNRRSSMSFSAPSRPIAAFSKSTAGEQRIRLRRRPESRGSTRSCRISAWRLRSKSMKTYSSGREITGKGLLRKAEMRRQAIKDLAQLGVAIDVDMPVGRLSRPEQQVVEIVRALGGKPGALLLDEPTATLNQEESAAAVRADRPHESAGLGPALYYPPAGRGAASWRQSDCASRRCGRRHAPYQRRIGRSADTGNGRPADGPALPAHQAEPNVEALRADHLYTIDGRVRDASFFVRRGEIVGIAGLVGSGKSELVRACFGLAELASGTIHIGGTVVEQPTPRQMLALGLVYLPQDRRDEALALNRSIIENVSLEVLDQPRFITPGGLVRDARLRETVDAIADRLDIRPRDIRQIVSALSGGNQQKVVLGRAFTRDRSVYIFHEPTAGVDIGARQEFYNVIKQICEGDTGVVLVSSDLPEIVHLSHRVYVMHSGQIQAELTGDEITDEAIASHSFGHSRAAH